MPNRLHTRAILPLAALLGLLAMLACPALAAEDAGPAGSVKNVTGVAQVARAGNAPKALATGDRIFEKDVLTTGKDSALGLIMRDNSTVSLGPGSRLVVERFLFEPQKGGLGLLLRVAKGSSAMVTGEIAKLSPENMKVMTPTATIGIRGTHFLVNVDEASADKASADKEVR